VILEFILKIFDLKRNKEEKLIIKKLKTEKEINSETSL
jgi:hypothetical protein